MTPEDFKLWRRMMALSQTEAAEALGLSKGSIENYERGTRREDDRPVEIPKTVALACAALYHRLRPWNGTMGAADDATPAAMSPAEELYRKLLGI